ncbi:MAG: LysR family transcriptional regulator, partial [Sphingomonadaceae bacterium]|nr:LysR family transcriptional regulator [Sphingomonadaceae bacterium]
RIMRRGEGNAINLATLPSFGMRWLAPRMAGITRIAPELIVNISARTHEFDFADEMFDAAIHFGRPNWPDAEHDRLFGERVVAVVAPTLLHGQAIITPQDFAAFPLLSQVERPDAWKAWFAQADAQPSRIIKGPTFEHFTMLAQAAIGGGGAALIPRFIIEEELASGALVAPLDISMSGDAAYYLVYPRTQMERPAFRIFRQWMLDAARVRSEAS